jgi:hypothetical protein
LPPACRWRENAQGGAANIWYPRQSQEAVMAGFINEDYYLKAKLAQVIAAGDTDADGNAYTLTTLKQAILRDFGSLEAHYKAYGAVWRKN